MTQSLKEAVQAAELEHVEQISVEVELWYRRDTEARDEASRRVRAQAEACGGTVVNECVIEGIDYHALLVELPVGEVESFYSEDPGGLVIAKQVMHLHRSTQTSVRRLDAVGESPAVTTDAPPPTGSPRIALLDGLPMSNHDVLPWRKVFTQQVEDVRAWGPQDRLTQSLKEAVQAAELEHVEQISVEVELWYRRGRGGRKPGGAGRVPLAGTVLRGWARLRAFGEA